MYHHGLKRHALVRECPIFSSAKFLENRFDFWGALTIVPLSFISPSLLYHLGGLIARGSFDSALMSLWPLFWASFIHTACIFILSSHLRLHDQPDFR